MRMIRLDIANVEYLTINLMLIIKLSSIKITKIPLYYHTTLLYIY
jgi:hypothetical protein